MSQVVFLTLFLGLTTGHQNVALDVNGDVAAVRLLLDGREIAVLHRAPWQAGLELGDFPLPHRLVAIGSDARGEEVARAEQKINLPRPSAELNLVFDVDQGRPKRVNIRWSSIEGKPPRWIKADAGGRDLVLDENLSAALPKSRADSPVIVHAIGESAIGEKVQASAVYGGEAYGAESLLTAVPITIASGPGPRAVGDLSGALVSGETRLRVAAIDDGPAEVIVVRDPADREPSIRYGLGRSVSRGTSSFPGLGGIASGARVSNDFLAKKDTVRFLWPYVSRSDPQVKADLFPLSPSFDGREGRGFRWLLTSLSQEGPPGKLRFADAVSMAGLTAFGSRRPRAVILVLSKDYRDESFLNPREARDYLAVLGVPLVVWSLSEPDSIPATAAQWGPATNITTVPKLNDAIAAVRESLSTQRILWVFGEYLPQEIRAGKKVNDFTILSGKPLTGPR